MSTQAYVDLMFAWGHARLGDEATARRLVAEAEERLRPTGNRAHTWLLDAFTYRIEQAIANRPHEGALPPGLIESLKSIDDDRRGPSRRYVVDRMRQASRILEPDAEIDPYLPWKRYGTRLQRQIAEVFESTSTDGSRGRLMTVLREVESSTDILDRCRYFRGMSQCDPDVARRIGGELIPVWRQYAVRLLRERWTDHPDAGQLFAKHMPPPGPGASVWEQDLYLKAAANPGACVESLIHSAAAELLIAAVILAARIRRQDLLAACYQDGLGLILEGCPVRPTDLILALTRGLIRLGMKPEARELSDRFAGEQRAAYERSGNPDHLVACLGLAALDFWLGRADRAGPVLHLACRDLPRLPHPAVISRVVSEYLRAASQTRWFDSRDYVWAILPELPRVASSYTTAPWYSLPHLQIVEQSVQTIATDDFSPSAHVLCTFSAPEIASRREALVEVRGKLMEWGQKDWGPAKSS
jgi:hypothetical protein